MVKASSAASARRSEIEQSEYLQNDGPSEISRGKAKNLPALPCLRRAAARGSGIWRNHGRMNAGDAMAKTIGIV